MTGTKRSRLAVVFAACSVCGIAAIAYGQSAVDAFDPGANGPIRGGGLAVQLDGRILVGGVFTTLGGGGTGTPTRNYIGRLNSDGSLDASFNPGVDGDHQQVRVETLVVQADGKILVGGLFNRLGGGTGTTTRNNIGRIDTDGMVDPTFDPSAGVSSRVNTIAVQPDGKILVGGEFTHIAGVTRNRIARLNADGSVDATFNPGADGWVDAVVVQPDGKILVAGSFTGLGGGTGTTPRENVGRLNADGSVDTGFSDPEANSGIEALALQPDGKVVIGGNFRKLSGTTRNYIGRLNADGSLDASLDPGANSDVTALLVRPNGQIVVGGGFTTLGGAPRNRIGRLNADGSVDGDFNPGADALVTTLVQQPEGRILVGGYFTGLGDGIGSVSRSRIARLACGEIMLTPTFLPNGTAGIPYNQALAQSGGLGATTLAVTSGALPNGISMSSEGLLSGTTTNNGAYDFVVSVTDADGCTGSRAYALTMVCATTGACWTDDPLRPGVTVVKAFHVTELRTRINTLRIACGLVAFAFTNASLGGVAVQAVHITEMRMALDAAYAACGVTPSMYTDPALIAGSPIKAAHFAELRNGVMALE